jgi:hypothetical protein
MLATSGWAVLQPGQHLGYIDAWVHISVLGNVLKILQLARRYDVIHELLQVRCGMCVHTVLLFLCGDGLLACACVALHSIMHVHPVMCVPCAL